MHSQHNVRNESPVTQTHSLANGAHSAVPIFLFRLKTPLGPYLLASSQQGLVLLEPEDHAQASLARWERDGARIAEGGPHNHVAAQELEEYFSAGRREFTLPLDLRGTPFQQAVWAALRAIPYGHTRSYSNVARTIGRPAASRAVGAASARNPLSIIVPCHRVIGVGGHLVGYGGGLERKQALLALETTALQAHGEEPCREHTDHQASAH